MGEARIEIEKDVQTLLPYHIKWLLLSKCEFIKKYAKREFEDSFVCTSPITSYLLRTPLTKERYKFMKIS